MSATMLITSFLLPADIILVLTFTPGLAASRSRQRLVDDAHRGELREGKCGAR